MALSAILQDPKTKASVVEACSGLIDEQVSAKGGMSGLAFKATYGLVKGVGSGYIPGAIDRILPDIVRALEPMWVEGLAGGDPVEHLSQNCDRAADQVLSVTDERIAQSNNGVVRSSYQKLRRSVKGDVAAAMPGLAKILGAHTPVAS
jgi:hypothetical protein